MKKACENYNYKWLILEILIKEKLLNEIRNDLSQLNMLKYEFQTVK